MTPVGQTSFTKVMLHPFHPETLRLLDLLQSEYVGLYGEPDPNPEGGVEKAIWPEGAVIALFTKVGGYNRAVAMAGWTHLGDGVACLRRMYVHYLWRGRGLSRQLLAEIEQSARTAGMRRLVLETGTAQTKAISLYRSSGYTETEPFGYYAGQETSVFLGRDL